MATNDETGDAVRRLDVELVRRGIFESRARARAAIEAGGVQVDGRQATRPGQLVASRSRIDATPAHPWASRAGVKLAAALDAFGVSVDGLHCLDIGASTGGFVDVLLTRGARRVTAVDVGRGQLLPRLAADPRVVSLEGQDARTLTLDMLGQAPAVVTCDSSFIGLAKVLPTALELASEDAALVALFKPQFEVGPSYVGKGGIVGDMAAADAAAQILERWLDERGWPVAAWTESPIPGGDGNRERLLLAKRTFR